MSELNDRLTTVKTAIEAAVVGITAQVGFTPTMDVGKEKFPFAMVYNPVETTLEGDHLQAIRVVTMAIIYIRDQNEFALASTDLDLIRDELETGPWKGLVAGEEHGVTVTRRAINEENDELGRIQALISDLPRTGNIVERLQQGDLFAQLRYRGPAQSLWRLAAIDLFDFSGPVAIAADVKSHNRCTTSKGFHDYVG
jgi:hypothetical protein